MRSEPSGLRLVLEVEIFSEMRMHAGENMQKISIAEATVFLYAVFSDGNQFLLGEDLKLLRHHGLAAPKFFV